MADFPFQWFIERFDRTRFVEVKESLSAILANQRQTNRLLGEIMATLQQFTTALARIDTATSGIATVLTQIRARVAELETTAGVSATDEASILNLLDGAATSLEAMGKNPENPVPVEPPVTPE